MGGTVKSAAIIRRILAATVVLGLLAGCGAKRSEIARDAGQAVPVSEYRSGDAGQALPRRELLH